MKVYPVFLNDLAGRRCVVFGGGPEAERKTRELIDCDAEILLVAEAATEGLEALAAAGRVQWAKRSYREGDLAGAFLAIATDTDPLATAPIYREAERERVLLNAMDDIPHCSFVAGSVVRRGALQIAISTSGLAPALSVRIRQQLEREFGPEYQRFLELARSLRKPMTQQYPDFEERRRRWYALIDSDVITVLRDEGEEAAVSRIATITGVHLTSEAGE